MSVLVSGPSQIQPTTDSTFYFAINPESLPITSDEENTIMRRRPCPEFFIQSASKAVFTAGIKANSVVQFHTSRYRLCL